MRAVRRSARTLGIAAVVLAGACGGYGTDGGYGGGDPPPTPVLTTVALELAANVVEIGQSTGAKASSFDQNGEPIASGAATYSSSAPSVAAVNPATGLVVGISEGTAQISGTIERIKGTRTITVFRPVVRINEIRTDGEGTLGFVELYNPSLEDVNVSGWTISTGTVQGGFTLPSVVIIPPGGFRVINESEIPGGLHAAGTVHLFNFYGGQVDSFEWTVDAPATYGRCPDATGAFILNAGITRGGVNACG